MANVERGVIQPPNLVLQGLAATRSCAPLAASPAARASHVMIDAGCPGGSADLTRLVSPMAPVSHRFNVETARMPQPAAAIEPGKGAVPVNPFVATGQGIARAKASNDDAIQFERSR
jgi:hypothetical protein